MTVTTELARAAFPWTGVETSFNCGFPAEESSHLRVYFLTSAGEESLLVLNVNYSVSLASTTRIATLIPISLPEPAGSIVVERGTPALVQEVLVDGQDFSNRVVQRLHDRAAMRSAEDRSRQLRALLLSATSEIGSGFFDAQGTAIAGLAPANRADGAVVKSQLDAGIALIQGQIANPPDSNVPNFRVAFGGTGGADDTAAFLAAEASASSEIYMPPGTYVSTVELTKVYRGPGMVLNKYGSVYQARGRRYTRITSLPERGENVADYFGGNLDHAQAEEFIIEATVDRQAVDTPYQDYGLIPHFTRMTVRSGHSGYDARMISGALPGGSAVQVNDITPFQVGDEVIVSPYKAYAEIRTISGIVPESGVIVFSVPLVNEHPAEGWAAVSKGARTMSPVYHVEFDVQGDRVGGDHGAYYARGVIGGTHNAGRDHAYDRSTGYLFGGDLIGIHDGAYLTGTEIAHNSQNYMGSFDIAVHGDVRNYGREAPASGTRGTFWVGMRQASHGNYSCDSAFVVAGKWKRALDTGTMIFDVGDDKQAILLGDDHRIAWGGKSTPDVDGFATWTDQPGDMLVRGYDENPSGTRIPVVEVSVKGIAALSVRDTGIAVGGTATVSQDIVAAGRVFAGYGGPGAFDLEAGASVIWRHSGGNTVELMSDGTNLYVAKNGGAPAFLA